MRTCARATDEATDLDALPESLREVIKAYDRSPEGALTNDTLYREVARKAGKPLNEFMQKQPIGKSGQAHSVEARRVRWHQQTAKVHGWLTPVPGRRGAWQLTDKARRALTPQKPKVVLVAYSTDIGVCLWGAAENVFSKINEPITLCCSSPPFPLAKPRAYGNVPLSVYVDWLCKQLEPIARNLVRGGTIALNVGNEIFEAGSPARSTYRERLVIAMCDRVGLHKVDELLWHNPTKLPGPVRWTSVGRMQLNAAWEPEYIFCNDPHACLADNRRVLQEHTERQLRLIQKGGVDKYVRRNDGAYSLRHGSFGKSTPGRIPGSVLQFVQSAADADLRRAREKARDQGLPVHGAAMPLGLADFLVRYLCPEDGLVADLFSGYGTSAYAAEINGRPWIASELMGEYCAGSAERFSRMPGFRRFLE